MEQSNIFSFKPKIKHVDTPFIDTGTVDPDGDEPTGVLSSAAASILTKVLHAARVARFDLLKSIVTIVERITQWTTRCDHCTD